MKFAGYYINLIKQKRNMTTSKKEALARLDAIEKEQKELRKIIEAPEKREKPTTLKEACENQGVDYKEFLAECAKFSKNESGFKKLKLIIKDVRGDWKPTLSNTWYYPYFKRTKTGLSFDDWGCDCVGDFFCTVTASLVLENSADAEYVGKTFEAEYNEYMLPE